MTSSIRYCFPRRPSAWNISGLVFSKKRFPTRKFGNSDSSSSKFSIFHEDLDLETSSSSDEGPIYPIQLIQRINLAQQVNPEVHNWKTIWWSTTNESRASQLKDYICGQLPLMICKSIQSFTTGRLYLGQLLIMICTLVKFQPLFSKSLSV